LEIIFEDNFSYGRKFGGKVVMYFVQEKAEKCTVRIALKLEKAGFKESRLWKMLRDNEAGVEGFVDEMKVEVMNDNIEVDYDSKKIKDRMDADLLKDGSFFRLVEIALIIWGGGGLFLIPKL